MTLILKSESTVVFTGDSVTDCRRDDAEIPLGHGYPLRVAGEWGAAHPERRIRWVNTGVAGNQVSDIALRWQSDVLAHDPDVVSILVGVNDCAFRFLGLGDEVTAAEYRDGYISLLEPLAERGVGLILLEPFLLPIDADQQEWRPDLDEKIHVVRELTDRFDAELLATDDLFTGRAQTTGPEFWAADGVHPTPAGHQVIADAWLEHVS